jgi:hypothetical protein
MDPNRFAHEVRPFLIEIRIGVQGIAFDRLDLDKWADEYKARNGRPGRAMKGGSSWGGKSHQDSPKEAKFGGFKKRLEIKEFEKALAQVTLSKPKNTSTT